MSEHVEVHVEGQPPRPPNKGGGGSFLMMIPGLGFLGLGVAVMVWPTLVQIMVAALCGLFGLGLLFAGRKVNRVRQKFATFDGHFRQGGPPTSPPGA